MEVCACYEENIVYLLKSREIPSFGLGICLSWVAFFVFLCGIIALLNKAEISIMMMLTCTNLFSWVPCVYN